MMEKCEDSETICEAVFETDGSSCNSHCQSLGLKCEDAWNDVSGTCAKEGHADNACDVNMSKQICRCKKGK